MKYIFKYYIQAIKKVLYLFNKKIEIEIMATVQQVKETNKHVGCNCIKCGKSVKNGKGSGVLLLSNGSLVKITIEVGKSQMPEGAKIVNMGDNCHMKFLAY